MTTYQVFKKGGGTPVYEYTADAPIELVDFPAATHDHTPVSAPTVTGQTVFGGRRKLTKLEYRKLLRPAEEVKFDRIRATFETEPAYSAAVRDMIRTFDNKYSEATVMDLDDPDQPRGLMLFLSLGALEGPNRILEILNG